jgi:hypothetical protein
MDSLQHRLATAKAQLTLESPRVALTYAQAGLALVTRRVQEQGLPGRAYSDRPIPKFWLKPTNGAGRAYLKREKKPTYKGLRGAQGMVTAVVNLTYTGAMLRSLHPVPAGVRGAVSFVKVVASDEQNAQKLAHNLKREGNFLEPNAQEQAQLQQVVQREFTAIINKALAG